jgi:SPASM domain peptide maturase of grasp-with-spasm system
MNKLNSYFKLHSNCILVKGASRATISDLHKGCYIFVSHAQYEVLIGLEKTKINLFLDRDKEIRKKELFLFLDNLVFNDLGIYCENPDRFPNIDSNFHSPYLIEDCIIELSNENIENEQLLRSLANLGCQTLELRSFTKFSLIKLSRFLDKLTSTRIRSVELILEFNEKIALGEYRDFINKHSIISSFILHGCNVNKLINLTNDPILTFEKQFIKSSSCCGVISPDNFRLNLPFYLESLKFNNCLNRKLSIDIKGFIRNCPSLEKTYGNINNTSLEEAINNPSFKSLWSVNKDKIKVCKDCEFRYICSDCRAYLSDSFDKPKKCNYNPYLMIYE